MKATITKLLLQNLPGLAAGKSKLRVFDDRLPGFIAERRPTGTTFYLRYADARRRSREVKLGRLGDVSVDQARKAAEKIKAEVSLGGDPVAERERRRAVPTVEAFFRERYLPDCQQRLLSHDCVERTFRRRILPAFGSKALNEVTPSDVSSLRKKLLDAGLKAATVNRHLAYTRAMFSAAIRWQLIEGRNPAASPGMLREQGRDRFLSPAETRALLAALEAANGRTAAAALVLLALTGARKQEVLKARWEQVDLGHGALTVPRAKSGKPRLVPLNPLAVALVRGQLAVRDGDCPWVFPSPTNAARPIGNIRRTWVAAKRTAGLPVDLRVHDLRHSFASVLANQGVPLFEIGAVLGHTQLSTTTRYAHHAPGRLVATATMATTAWNLIPGTE